MISMDSELINGAKIRVIGVGGGGGNAVNSMIERGLSHVEFIVANTDAQALTKNQAAVKIHVGRESTRGLGAGADPKVGKLAVEESIQEIKDALAGSDMIFVTAGMGGGTGTGGAPVVAAIGRELGALVVGIVTKPFKWEAARRAAIAEEGIKELRSKVDALIVIPNQKIMDIIDKQTTFKTAFSKVDDVLYNATRGIADIISGSGLINVDFADVKTIMKDMGDALMGMGVAEGEKRATKAAELALKSPLLEGLSIKGAKGLLVNITGGNDLKMNEIEEAMELILAESGVDTNFIQGLNIVDEMDDKVMVTVLATGFNSSSSMPISESSNIDKYGVRRADVPQNERSNVEQSAPYTGTYKPKEQRTPSTLPTPSDYSELDTPAWQRRQQQGSVPVPRPAGSNPNDPNKNSQNFLRNMID
jgi:cell division protein FtsZ